MELRLIDAASVHRLLDYAPLVEALEAAHRAPPPLVGRVLLEPPPGAGRVGEGFLVLPAWAHGRAFGVKMVTIVPANAERAAGPPTVQAVYQLFEGTTGRPLAVIDGTALTLRKTAANSGLGAKLLARADARTLLMIGAGALAPHLIGAHRAVRPSLDPRPGLEPQRAAARPAARGARRARHPGRAGPRPRGRGAHGRRGLGRDARRGAPGARRLAQARDPRRPGRRLHADDARGGRRGHAPRAASTSTTRARPSRNPATSSSRSRAAPSPGRTCWAISSTSARAAPPAAARRTRSRSSRTAAAATSTCSAPSSCCGGSIRKRPPEPDDAVPPPVRAAGAAPPSRRSTRRWLSSSGGPWLDASPGRSYRRRKEPR